MRFVAPNDTTRQILLALLIGLLLAGSFWTLLPFLAALIWATTIVVATWPVLLFVQGKSGLRRSVAAAIMTVIVLLIFIVPFVIAISTLLDVAQRAPAALNDLLARGLQSPPQWLEDLPIVGERIAVRWRELQAGSPEEVAETIRPYARQATSWAVAASGGLAIMIVHALLTIALVAILYLHGETAAGGVLAFMHRLAGQRGEQMLRLAGRAVRSIAFGLVVTALAQSLLAGLGLWVSGVPHAGVLTAIVFTLGIVQLGPLPVLACAVIWLYWSDSPGWATALLVWSLPVVALDNVLRPILIRRGVEAPMLLVIAGVIGGLIGFGVVGLFAGPVVLTVTYTLARHWVAPRARDAADESRIA